MRSLEIKKQTKNHFDILSTYVDGDVDDNDIGR